MNFKPRTLKLKTFLSKSKLNRICCRNFIFTILIFELFNTKQSIDFTPVKFNIHIIKKRKHIGSILRAPYKNKIAQFSIGLYRYYLVLSFIINTIYKPNITNLKEFNINIKYLLNSYNYFESTLVTQISRTILIPIYINII